MTNPTGGDAFCPAVLWNLIALVVPIIVAVIVATHKVLTVIRAEIRSEITPIIGRIDAMEKRFVDAVRDLWDHNNSQDTRIEAVMAAHNRLHGAHDAIIHGERRATPRVPEPHCPKPK